MTLVLEHERFAGVVLDQDFHLRFALQMRPDGSQDIYIRHGEDWQLWIVFPRKICSPVAWRGLIKPSKKCICTTAAVGTPRRYLPSISRRRPAHSWPKTHALTWERSSRHPTEHTIQAVSFTYARKSSVVLDPAVQADLDALATVATGDIQVVSRTLDDRLWVVAYAMDTSPTRYYLYNRQERQAQWLFTDRPALEQQPLATMHPVVLSARDGLRLVSYYTLPPGSDSNADGIPDQPVPMVLLPHGGPWARNAWGYHPYHQWLANRGYAVLSVNFRSSTGFGKAFINAGDHEWGGKIWKTSRMLCNGRWRKALLILAPWP